MKKKTTAKQYHESVRAKKWDEAVRRLARQNKAEKAYKAEPVPTSTLPWTHDPEDESQP